MGLTVKHPHLQMMRNRRLKGFLLYRPPLYSCSRIGYLKGLTVQAPHVQLQPYRRRVGSVGVLWEAVCVCLLQYEGV
jgi:hypothetical protein